MNEGIKLTSVGIGYSYMDAIIFDPSSQIDKSYSIHRCSRL